MPIIRCHIYPTVATHICILNVTLGYFNIRKNSFAQWADISYDRFQDRVREPMLPSFAGGLMQEKLLPGHEALSADCVILGPQLAAVALGLRLHRLVDFVMPTAPCSIRPEIDPEKRSRNSSSKKKAFQEFE